MRRLFPSPLCAKYCRVQSETPNLPLCCMGTEFRGWQNRAESRTGKPRLCWAWFPLLAKPVRLEKRCNLLQEKIQIPKFSCPNSVKSEPCLHCNEKYFLSRLCRPPGRCGCKCKRYLINFASLLRPLKHQIPRTQHHFSSDYGTNPPLWT